MANTITSNEVNGTDQADGMNGAVVRQALNRIGAPTPDNTLFLDGAAFVERAIVGTWAVALGANNVPEAGKTANTEVGRVSAAIDQHTRQAAERGLFLVGADLFYQIETAAANDVLLQILDYDGSVAEGAEPGTTILAGDADAHYDADHDTAGERGSLGVRKLTVTIPTATVLGGGHGGALEILADSAGTTVFTVLGAVLLFKRVDADVLSPV